MKKTVYLVVTRDDVRRMVKTLPTTFAKGEIPVKLTVVIPAGAFSPPMIEREITVADWAEGMDLARLDVQLDRPFITEEEAAMIRQRRLAEMAKLLGEHGYSVVPPEPDHDKDQDHE